MTKRTRILLLSVIILVIGTTGFFICKYIYESERSELKEKARTTFIEAMNRELKSRKLHGYSSFLYAGSSTSISQPDSVFWEDETGKHRYRIDKEKSDSNITEDTSMRSAHSVALLKEPIHPDSLNMKWGECLREAKLPFQSALFISVTDEHGDINSRHTSQSEWCTPSDLVLTVYIGYANEIEVLGYLQLSAWSMIRSAVLCCLLFSIVCVGGLYKISVIVWKILTASPQKEIVEVPAPHSYIIYENIIFDAEQDIIEINGVKKKIASQSSQLLELFLKEENYFLADNVIKEKLWGDLDADARLCKAITRLRYTISTLGIEIELKRKGKAYQLILK